MKAKYIEAEDSTQTYHGKFLLGGFDDSDWQQPSVVDKDLSLLEAVRPLKRFGGSLTTTALFVLDLQTREGILFDPAQDAEIVRRTFLLHPVHVCLLFYPLMQFLRGQSDIWDLPHLVRLDIFDVASQPGLLVDSDGVPVRGMLEWSRRAAVMRLRNREVEEGADPEEGQDEITEEDAKLAGSSVLPRW